MCREECSPALKSTAHTPVDFAVKLVTPADWTFFGNDAGVHLLFVDLKAPNEESCQEDPDNEIVNAKLQKKKIQHVILALCHSDCRLVHGHF